MGCHRVGGKHERQNGGERLRITVEEVEWRESELGEVGGSIRVCVGGDEAAWHVPGRPRVSQGSRHIGHSSSFSAPASANAAAPSAPMICTTPIPPRAAA